jgi:type VI secretion system secreted protein VgrG
MASITQINRLMKFSCPLGDDALLIESLQGSEGVSRLFEFHAELLSEVQREVNPNVMVGARVSVSIALTDVRGSRYINGIVASFEQDTGDSEFNMFHARIVPALWETTLRANCRVFQNKSALEIVKAVIGEYGLSIVDRTTIAYKPLDYCTQYSETDFHFLSRLLEENGICYWFEHTESNHAIVLADSTSAYVDCPLLASIPFAINRKGADGSYGARIEEISASATWVPSIHSTAEFDFRKDQRVDTGAVHSSSPYGKGESEQFLYPVGVEGYLKKTDASNQQPIQTRLLQVRKLAADAVSENYSGSSSARSMCAGYVVTLKDHPRSALNKRYFLTAVNLSCRQVPSYRSRDNSAGGYDNRFSAVEATVTYVAPRTATKPIVYGPQTARVVAPSGEEMYIDKFGRVCVQFLWDRKRQPNTVDNTWVRVAQPWAGNGWGTFFWPRLNDEVIIQFVDGDPDNPILAGSVYNGVNVPKYALPDHSTRSGLVTRSSKGGSAANANELRFEDKMGSEQIFLNAERDMDHRVEQDHRMFVGGKDSLIVKGDQLEEVDGKYGRTIKGNAAELIRGNSGLEVMGNLAEKIDGDCMLQVGSNQSEKVGQNYSLDAGTQIYLKGGQMVVIESGMELCLKSSGGFISIGPSGVTISGTMVLINSGGAAGSGSAGSVDAPLPPDAPDQADDGSKGGKM